MDVQDLRLQGTEVWSLALLPSGRYKPELTAMSSLVSQYTEHVAMRVEDAVTASGTVVHSFLASFISLHSL